MPELPTQSDRPDAWPFFRQDPTCVVLGVRPGHTPNGLPPVRIFLGTEEAQYRAERIFFYSVEKVRDPARVYEIHLMKNVLGFDRRKWRTGFTNYRYAIPAFAGGTGRAIYNDVDQIYLVDPALLFDLDMGEHGYLAISAKDTSVMLIDCAKMLPLWNRETASTLGKHALIDKPSGTPGLWGELDGHWNARDQEYVEGRTKCLHYTALHQQPWHPFPEVFSYHPNPLAYIWYDLERAADAEDYEPFTASAPSPDFALALGRNRPADEPAPAPGTAAVQLFADLEVKDALIVHLGASAGADSLGPLLAGRQVYDLHAGLDADWPENAVDAVIASGILPILPPADLPWLVGQLFKAARKVVYIDATAVSPEGLGSAGWWRQRIDEIALRHPGKSWHLTVRDTAAPIPGTVRHFAMRVRKLPGRGTVWALLDGDPANDIQVRALAEALDFDCVEKPLDVASTSLDAPWPDVVIAAGPKAAAQALEIKSESRGAVRVVQIGVPGAPFERFDLVVANPAERLPVRPNVEQVAAPLVAADGAGEVPADGLDIAIVGPVQRPYKRSLADARTIGRTLSEQAKGKKAVYFTGPIAEEERKAILDAAGGPEVIDEAVPLDEVIGRAARLYTTGDDPLTLTRVCASGKPALLIPLPYWYDGIPGSKPVLNVLTLLIGGGTSYRGTPHQQHVLGRLVDTLVARGWLTLPEDPARLHRALAGRGLLRRSDEAEPMASPKPLDDCARVAEAVRRLLTRAPLAEA